MIQRYTQYANDWRNMLLAVLLAIAPAAAVEPGPANGAADGSAERALGARLDEIAQLSGRFRQTVYPQAGGRATVSTGEFRLQSPGRFLWRIDAPDNQLVVTRGEYLWHYDADLQTATRRPIDAVASAPLQVLAGDRESLARDFAVTRSGEASYTLIPRNADAGFQSLELTLDAGIPRELAIVDNLSQRIEISLDAVSTDAIDADVFDFTPPDGVDVFIHDA